MRKPKKPKALKKPKAGASLATLEAWVKKKAAQESEYKKKLSEYEKAQKLRAKIKNM
jgi:hypothetical protein